MYCKRSCVFSLMQWTDQEDHCDFLFFFSCFFRGTDSTFVLHTMSGSLPETKGGWLVGDDSTENGTARVVERVMNGPQRRRTFHHYHRND